MNTISFKVILLRELLYRGYFAKSLKGPRCPTPVVLGAASETSVLRIPRRREMAGKNVKDNGMCRVAHAWLRGMRPRNGTSVSHGVYHKTRGLIARLSESLPFPPPSLPPSFAFAPLNAAPRILPARLLSFAFAISPPRNVHQILYRIFSRRIAFVRYNRKVLRGEK